MGVGQGNGAGPAAYAFLSAILIKVLASLGYGVVFTTALSLITFNTVCSMFVNDCDLWQSATDVNEKGEDVVRKMQEAAATWESCLAASEGALSPQKSFWYLIDYKWTGDRWVYRTKEEMTATIQMHDKQGSLQTLQRHEPTHPEKTLGMLTAPDGSMESFGLDDAGEQIRVGQIPYLQEKVKEFTTKIKSARNTLPNDVWVAIASTIMKTLEYPMTASTITKQGWDEIMKPRLRYCLPVAGYSVWEELASKTHTGEFITTSMEALRLELGYPSSLMSVPFDRMAGYTTDSWLTSLWETCNKWNIDIKSIAPELQQARVYNQFLMQAFAQNKNIMDKELPILNK